MVHIVGLSIETTAPTDSAITPIMVREINIGEIPLGLRLGSDTTLLDARSRVGNTGSQLSGFSRPALRAGCSQPHRDK